MNIQTASAKGQVTIPVAIRKKLGIEPGTAVRFVERDGSVMFEKIDANISALFGILKARKGATLEQLKEGVEDEVAERFGSR